MQSDNGVAFKVFVTDGRSDPEVRRFSVDKCAVTSFEYMKAKIQSVFPSIAEGGFTLSWKDEDGDDVVISSDEELILALSSIRDDLKKLYVKKQAPRMPDIPMMNIPVMEIPLNIGGGQFFAPPACGSAGKKRTFDANSAHPGVTCDGCQGPVVGYRYKCVVCDDFDLCSICEQKNIHSEHFMMRIPVPVGQLGNKISKVFCKVMKRMGDFEEASEARECVYSSKRSRKERCAEGDAKQGHHQKVHGKHGSRHEEKRKHYEEKRQRRDGHHHMNGGWLNTFTNYMNEFANLAGDIGAQAATAAAGNMGATTSATAGNAGATASACAGASTAGPFTVPPSTPQPPEQQTSNNNAPNGNDAFNSAKAAHDLHIQYMQNVGRTVAKMLDPLGIDVDIEIRPKASETNLNVQSQATQSNENDVPKPKETVNKESPVIEIKDGSSSSSDDDSSDSDSGQKPEGWTFIHPKDGVKKADDGNTRTVGFDLDRMAQEFQKQMEIHTQPTSNSNPPPVSTSTGIYPTIPLPDASAPMEVTDVNVPVPSTPVNIPISVPTPPPRTNTLKPEIAEAYNRMLAMGFKDDGDRLVRLLESKNGNINEVLDVLSMHIPRV